MTTASIPVAQPIRGRVYYLVRARIKGQPEECGTWIQKASFRTTFRTDDRDEAIHFAQLLSPEWVSPELVICDFWRGVILGIEEIPTPADSFCEHS
jgi:hypothetical protein